MSCEARQYSDQMHCKRCDLTWDMNDYDPPECLTPKEIGQRTIATLYRELEHEPRNLPPFTPTRCTGYR